MKYQTKKPKSRTAAAVTTETASICVEAVACTRAPLCVFAEKLSPSSIPHEIPDEETEEQDSGGSDDRDNNPQCSPRESRGELGDASSAARAVTDRAQRTSSRPAEKIRRREPALPKVRNCRLNRCERDRGSGTAVERQLSLIHISEPTRLLSIS